MAEQPDHIFVDGIVASKSKLPAVVISTDKGIVVQLGVADARQIANDILRAAHNAEADAMIYKFFAAKDFPKEAAGACMVQFRDFRHSLDHPDDQARAVKPEEG